MNLYWSGLSANDFQLSPLGESLNHKGSRLMAGSRMVQVRLPFAIFPWISPWKPGVIFVIARCLGAALVFRHEDIDAALATAFSRWLLRSGPGVITQAAHLGGGQRQQG
jgi:hypothetical protein